MKIHRKYKPLFNLIAGKLPDVHTCIVYGGRESGKTFTTGLALGDALVNHNHRILYTRYTMAAADKSIIPAFQNRLELLGYDEHVTINKKSIEAKSDRGRVDFSGIKTSSGNQTANLKSIEDYSVLIIDEAEEWTSEDEFDKIELSIRSKDVSPFTIIVMNPTDTSHFVYQKFFLKKDIPNQFNGIIDGVLYIWSSYLDIGKENVAKKNWIKFEKARVIYENVEAVHITEREELPTDMIKHHAFYKYKVLGHWNSKVDNRCIEYWSEFDEFPEEEPDFRLFGLDFGMSPDPSVLGETRVYGNKIYTKEHFYKNNMLNQEITDYYNAICPDGNTYIVADSSSKNQISELRKLGLPIIKAKKGPDSIQSGIQKINSMELFVNNKSKNAIFELNNYHYVAKVNLLNEVKVVPVDKDNHFIDQLRYTLNVY